MRAVAIPNESGRAVRPPPSLERGWGTPRRLHDAQSSGTRHGDDEFSMQTTAAAHLVCPRTQRPLRLQPIEVDGNQVICGDLLTGGGPKFEIRNGVADFLAEATAPSQTVRSFEQKWAKHDYYREHTRDFYTQWYLQRYGFFDPARVREFLRRTRFILDAGTGSGRDAQNFAEWSSATVYGVDTSREALEIARRGVDNPRVAFVRADLHQLPFPDEFFDFVSCDQVIHHTPDPHAAFSALTRKLKPGGQIACYVYKKKAVIREFVDDYVRERISRLPMDEALAACEGITELGQKIAALHAKITLEKDIPVLGIEKGTHDLQRFLHWNVMKCFWNDDFDFFTNNMINVDWYHPEYCFRFTPAGFRCWFDAGWDVQTWDVQDAGVSCRARKL